jgi:hypothetical protein
VLVVREVRVQKRDGGGKELPKLVCHLRERWMDDLYVNGDLDFTYLSHELVKSHVQLLF